MEKQSRVYVVGAGLLLTLMVCSALLGVAFNQDRLIRQQTYEHADAIYKLIQVARNWNAGYGGLYARKKAGEAPTPRKFYYAPDITDSHGTSYAMKNPHTMTRELSELAQSTFDFRFHITSTKLRNPANAADEWEKRALAAFENGRQEVTEVVTERDLHYFRFMRPLYVEGACLACHADQGYKIGQVRGGISVSLPFEAASKALRQNLVGMIGLVLIIVLFFLLILYSFIWRLTERLSQQTSELRRLNATKDRFLGMAAHDLRNPLTAINGYAALLEMDINNEEQLMMLSDIRSSADRMLRMVNDLLDVSKIESGHLELNLQQVPLAPFFQRCSAINALLARQKNINLQLSVPPDIGTATFDPEYMQQVLENLLSNAFKYSHAATTVTLGVERDDGVLRIDVTDQGIGMKESELPHIFDAFVKTSSRPTAGESSTGLGLAIVKKVVELHQGTINVRSVPAEGTIFTITLPLRPENLTLPRQPVAVQAG